MADNGYNGRELLISVDVGGTPTLIAAVTTKSPNRARTAVDVTTDDDNGWRSLLANPGNKSVDLSVEGVLLESTTFDATAFMNQWYQSAELMNVTVETPSELANNGTETGLFFLASFNTTGSQDGSVTFTAELQSSGEITYTAPSAA